MILDFFLKFKTSSLSDNRFATLVAQTAPCAFPPRKDDILLPPVGLPWDSPPPPPPQESVRADVCMLTSEPDFLGSIGYQICLPMVLRSAAFAASIVKQNVNGSARIVCLCFLKATGNMHCKNGLKSLARVKTGRSMHKIIITMNRILYGRLFSQHYLGCFTVHQAISVMRSLTLSQQSTRFLKYQRKSIFSNMFLRGVPCKRLLKEMQLKVPFLKKEQITKGNKTITKRKGFRICNLLILETVFC